MTCHTLQNEKSSPVAHIATSALCYMTSIAPLRTALLYIHLRHNLPANISTKVNCYYERLRLHDFAYVEHDPAVNTTCASTSRENRDSRKHMMSEVADECSSSKQLTRGQTWLQVHWSAPPRRHRFAVSLLTMGLASVSVLNSRQSRLAAAARLLLALLPSLSLFAPYLSFRVYAA